MKQFLTLICLSLGLLLAPLPGAGIRPGRAQEAQGDLPALEQKALKLLQVSDSAEELELINQWLLEMYLWSKDNFEPRQWPELLTRLERWPAVIQQRRPVLRNNNLIRLRALEASYWLLLHDYTKARQIAQQLPPLSIGPYPGMVQALLGEQDPDNPGVWRISLEQARILVRRYPRYPLNYVLLTEALLERIEDPANEAELLGEAHWAVRQALKFRSSAYALYQQGQILYLQGRTQQARAHFEQRVALLGPVAAEAVGNFYAWMKEPETALLFYEQARQGEPAALRVYAKMEQLYLQSRPAEAVRLYLRGLGHLPEELGFYQRLQGLYGQTTPERLRTWLKQELPAGSYVARLILGDLALREGDQRSAEHWYGKALEQRPRQLDAYANLLALYWEKRDLARIGQLLEQAAGLGLKHAELNYWKGVLALQHGELDQAIALFEPLARQDGQSLYMLAMTYRQKKDFVKARQLLSLLIEQDTQNVSLLLTLGDLYREEGDFARAEEVYWLAQRLQPYHAPVYFSLGQLFVETERYDRAVEVLERAILIAPDELDFRNNLGNVYIRQQRLKDAIREFEAIVARRPDYAEAYYNLACAHALSRQTDLALRYLQQAFALDGSLRQAARQDQDLAGLRSDQRFQEMLR